MHMKKGRSSLFYEIDDLRSKVYSLCFTFFKLITTEAQRAQRKL